MDFLIGCHHVCHFLVYPLNLFVVQVDDLLQVLLLIPGLGHLLAVLTVSAMAHIKLALALESLQVLHGLGGQHAQLDTFRIMETEQIVCNLGRVYFVILVTCASLIVLHHSCWEHGIAEFLTGQELFQGIGVIASKLQSDKCVLRPNALFL